MVLFLGVGPPFVNPGLCPSGQHLDSHLEGPSSQLSASVPLGGVLLPLGVVPVGLGDGVGDRHDAAVLQQEGLFISLNYFWESRLYFFSRVCLVIFVCCWVCE